MREDTCGQAERAREGRHGEERRANSKGSQEVKSANINHTTLTCLLAAFNIAALLVLSNKHNLLKRVSEAGFSDAI